MTDCFKVLDDVQYATRLATCIFASICGKFVGIFVKECTFTYLINLDDKKKASTTERLCRQVFSYFHRYEYVARYNWYRYLSNNRVSRGCVQGGSPQRKIFSLNWKNQASKRCQLKLTFLQSYKWILVLIFQTRTEKFQV